MNHKESNSPGFSPGDILFLNQSKCGSPSPLATGDNTKIAPLAKSHDRARPVSKTIDLLSSTCLKKLPCPKFSQIPIRTRKH
jgi:hypothetical protein